MLEEKKTSIGTKSKCLKQFIYQKQTSVSMISYSSKKVSLHIFRKVLFSLLLGKKYFKYQQTFAH